MIGQTFRASRSTVLRIARMQTTISTVATRTFIKPTAVRKADFVQDLYLRELKSYKPAPLKPNDSEGHVHVFSLPKAPQSPEEADIVSELKAYEDSVVEVEGQNAGGEEQMVEEDWFVEDDEDEDEASH